MDTEPGGVCGYASGERATSSRSSTLRANARERSGHDELRRNYCGEPRELRYAHAGLWRVPRPYRQRVSLAIARASLDD